ncbi:MAG: putative inorganic carbon transporter subunit DabA, partial [bacterium]
AGLSPLPMPRFEVALTPDKKAQTAAVVLRAMSLTTGHARLVLLVGHGAQVTNNPHESAYHCGACSGQTGEVSSRLLAALLNDPETRAGLPAQGLALPDDTLFVAGLHDTVTDRVTLYRDAPAPDHAADLARAEAWLAAAGHQARAERALRLPCGQGDDLARRAGDWAEVRPEWGLAGCATFIAAHRSATAGRNLQGRAFLHSYDWTHDKGFATLELILTAPVVVASWISLQYYGSTVAPQVFGGGNKLIHNVVGGLGVVEGNGGLLRPGLPFQAVHDGENPAHEALRLSVMIEAPVAAITEVLRKHEAVRALFDNGWLHLFALKDGKMTSRYRPGLTWEGNANIVGVVA